MTRSPKPNLLPRRAVARVFARLSGVALMATVLGFAANGVQAQSPNEDRARMQAERQMARERLREERRANRPPPQQQLSPEERQQLRRDIRNHGRDVYGQPPGR
ncbi:MAG: hypothetical protein ABIU95_08980 [Burkholderiales bacterium]